MQTGGMKNFIRLISTVGIFFMSWLPPAVFIYMISGSLLSLIQVYVFNKPSIRKSLGIPLLNNPVKPKPGLLATEPLTFKQAKKLIQQAQ